MGIYRARADLPLMAQATLSTWARLMEEAVDEAKQSIRPHSFVGTLSKGTSGRIARCLLTGFGGLKSPTWPRQAAKPFWEAPIFMESGASSFCP